MLQFVHRYISLVACAFFVVYPRGTYFVAAGGLHAAVIKLFTFTVVAGLFCMLLRRLVSTHLSVALRQDRPGEVMVCKRSARPNSGSYVIW